MDAIEAKTGKLSASLFEDTYRKLCVDNDKAMSLVMALQWVAAILIALYVSPKTWIGETSQIHMHVWVAALLGGALSALPIYLTLRQPGELVNRYVNVIAQALYSALFIHLSGGRIESHFHVFASLAGFAFYRDLRVLLCGTAVVAFDHAVRGIYFPESAFGVFASSEWRWVEHAAWVLFEDFFLGFSCIRALREMKLVARKTAEVMVQNEKIEVEVQKRTAELRESRNAVKLLLDNAGQGFFSFDKKGIIGSDSSKIVGTIFSRNPAGRHISELFGQPRADWNDYVELFFTSRLSFKELKGLCPSELACNSKSIALDYEPVLSEAGKLLAVLVVATDITELKHLEKRAEAEKSENAALIKVLASKNDFLELRQMVEDLAKTESDPPAAHRLLHTVKGGFSLLECHAISQRCHVLEAELNEKFSPAALRSGVSDIRAMIKEFMEKNENVLNLKPDAERVVSVEVSRLKKLIADAQSRGVPREIRAGLEELAERPIAECLGWLSDAFVLTGRRLGKNPEPISWFPSARICPDLYAGLMMSLVHIARNSADHGIEPTGIRKELGKPERGRLTAKLEERDNWYVLTFRDDGGGIDEGAVRRKANQLGLPAPKTSEEVMRLLLSGEFSTKTEITETSGRGIGLCAIRSEVEKLGGSITIRSELGQGTAVELQFPKLAHHAVAPLRLAS
jgi:signal transduction histidine kinase/PAS domain-containing protein